MFPGRLLAIVREEKRSGSGENIEYREFKVPCETNVSICADTLFKILLPWRYKALKHGF